MHGITHREFRTWREWKKDQWNNPNRSDYYIMQLTGYVANIMGKRSWNIKDYKVPINFGGYDPQTFEQRVAADKSRWNARAGKG